MRQAENRNLEQAEIARFDALAGQWWDENGPMRPLHRMNPARIAWIAGQITRHFGAANPRILDIGCGAGLAAEGLARLGHKVLGLDAAGAAIAAARAHAEASREGGTALDLTYREGTAEDLMAEGLRFPVVTCLEVVEHVPEPEDFLRLLAGLLEPGGLLVLSTLNRTTASLLTAKIGAEYVLRLLPAGTHSWRRFLKPEELAALARAAGLRQVEVTGLGPDLRGTWHTGGRRAVNYLASFAN